MIFHVVYCEHRFTALSLKHCLDEACKLTQFLSEATVVLFVITLVLAVTLFVPVKACEHRSRFAALYKNFCEHCFMVLFTIKRCHFTKTAESAISTVFQPSWIALWMVHYFFALRFTICTW